MKQTSTFLFCLLLLSLCFFETQAENSLFKSLTGPNSAVVCSGEYYDSGGIDADYGNNAMDELTICPDDPTEVVSIFFSAFSSENLGITGCYDQLTIYNGATTGEPVIPSPSPDTDGWCWDRADAEPNGSGDLQDMTIVSTSLDGCLTFLFTSDGSVTRPGWEATYECLSSEAPPVPAFKSNPEVTCNGAVTFENQSIILGAWTDITYAWDFGDGNTSTQASPSHTYAAEGIYDVTLEMCNQFGCNDTIVVAAVEFNSQVSACFEFLMPINGEETITSCMGTLYDSGGPDGNYQLQENGSVTIFAGDLNVLQLSINELNLSTFGDDIFIYDGPDTNSPLLGTFTGTQIPDEPIISNSNKVTIQFIANAFAGLSGFAIEFECIPVEDPPTANVILLPPFSCGGDFQFNDASTNVPDSWTWDFGDGTTSTEQSPAHSYGGVGEYTVSLTACNVLGCDDTTFAVQVYNLDDPTCSAVLMPSADNTGTIVNVTECTGILQDSGGEGTAYMDSEFGTVILGNEGAADVTLTFTEFSVASGDFVNVYDGANNSAPLLGSYSEFFLPEGGNPIVSSGSYLTVEFVSDFSTTNQGFTAYWTTNGSTEAPTANFEVSDLNPPFNTPVQFTDLTTESPSSWFWNFGEGGNSFAQNPAYSYETAGSFVVTMAASNCVGASDAPPQTITVQEPPLIIVNPDEFYIELESGETLDTSMTISNFGAGDLVYNIDGPQNSYTGTIDIVVYNFGTELDQNHIENTLEIIEGNLSGINYTETNTTSPEELAALLNNKEIFLLPGQRDVTNPDVMADFEGVLSDYVANGGTVFFTGSNQAELVYNTGLLDGTFGQELSNPLLSFTDSNHPITQGVAEPFDGKAGCVGFNITNDDKITLVEENGTDVISVREVGEGKVIFFGFNYRFSNESMDDLLVQAVLYGTGSGDAQWLFPNPTTDTLSAGQVNTVVLTFDAVDSPAGIYTVDMIVESNSPDFPEVVVPCTLVITGTPVIDAAPYTVDFGNVVQFTEESVTFTIFNTGSDTLFITDVVPDYDAFSVDTTNFWVYPGEGQIITITYSPLIIEDLLEIPINVTSNAGDIVILANANATGAPVSIATPSPIEITLNVEETGSVPIEISNPGQGFLEYCIGTTIVGENTGFLFEFETNELSFMDGVHWDLLDSEGSIVQLTFAGNYSTEEVNFSEMIGGLDITESYTLVLFNDFAFDGFANYTISDMATGEVIATGDFLNIAQADLQLGSPTQNPSDLWATLDGPVCDTLAFPDGLSEYIINFNAAGLLGGTYETTILITSNDPLNPVVEVPVIMTVIGVPEIVLVEPEDATLDFGSLLVGLTNSLSFTITNPGTDNLIVSDFLIDDDQYTFDYDNANLAPGESIVVTVTFAPSAIGIFDNTFTIVNNAGDVVITIIGEGQGAPFAVIAPGAIEMTLLSGESESVDLILSNSGEGNMEYTIPFTVAELGFLFEFTLDNFGGEFFWSIVDSQGNVVYSVPSGSYESNTSYSIEILNLDLTETYTLILEDTFGDGALTNYSITDLATGNVIVTGSFPTGNYMEEILGTPIPAVDIVISPTSGDIGFPEDQIITVTVDADGLLAGIYTFIIEIETNDPQNSVIEVPVTITVIAFPQAVFTADNEAVVCGDDIINFTDVSVNLPTEWMWNFGDGIGTSTDQNPTYAYTTSGTYDITLIASNDVGSDTLILNDFITVDQACQVVIVPDENTETIDACNGKLFDSGGEDGNYEKNNDGIVTIAPSGAAAVEITFSSFEVEPFDTLIIYDGPDINSPLIGKFNENNPAPTVITSSGSSITFREKTDGFIEFPGYVAFFSCIAPDLPPEAGIASEPINSCSGEIQFSDASMNFPNSWSWDFGDGNTSDQADPVHQYTTSDTYTITLTVSNGFGESTTMTDIEVIVLDPDVTIPASADSGESVSFEGGNAAMANYTWDFGDGSASQSVPSPSYTYDVTETTTFTVTVVVTSPTIGADCEITIMQEITIIVGDSPPIAAFDLVAEECSGQVQFTDTSLPAPTSWSWSFGDGNDSTDQNPEHQFSSTGTYTVTLTVSNDFGENTIEQDITVDVVSADVTLPNNALSGEELTFEGGNADAEYTWDFGDGSDPITGSSVTHTYEGETSDTYTVAITVVSGDCTFTLMEEVLFTGTSLATLQTVNLVVAPNPTDNFVNINIELVEPQDLTIVLTDVTGKEVINKQIEDVKEWKDQIDLSKQADGVYFIRFIANDQQIVKKLIIQR